MCSAFGRGCAVGLNLPLAVAMTGGERRLTACNLCFPQGGTAQCAQCALSNRRALAVLRLVAGKRLSNADKQARNSSQESLTTHGT